MNKNIYHAFNRLLAMMADFLISLNIYSFFHALGPYENWEVFLGGPLPIIFLNYVAFRALFNFFLGTSLSQYILGLRGNGTFFWKRIGGIVRSVYEIPSLILFPLVEFPLLLGKKTLKEYLSPTEISGKNKGVSFFGIFIFLPLTFCLAIFSPFYEILFTRTPEVYPKLSRLTQMESKSNISYSVEGAGLLTRSTLKNGNLVLIPSYKVTKWGDKNEFRPEYLIYDKALKRKLSFYFESGPDILSWIDEGKFLNPFFRVLYPELYSLDKKNIGTFLAHESEELELMIENSLSVDKKKLFSYVLNNGVFVRAPLYLKNKILSSLPADKIEKIKLGDKTFFCFKEFKSGKTVETFLPLHLDKAFTMKLTHNNDYDFRGEFLSAFFYFSTWNTPSPHSSFYLTKDSIEYNKFAGERLLDLAKESLSLKDPLFQDVVLDNLDRFIFVSGLNKEFDSEILKQLKGLKSTLVEKSVALKGQ